MKVMPAGTGVSQFLGATTFRGSDFAGALSRQPAPGGQLDVLLFRATLREGGKRMEYQAESKRS
jgi:hypothetical protein